MRIGVKPGQWGWRFDELEASWAAAEECGFDIVSCFDHVTYAPASLAAWDAPSLLTAMAGCTERIRLAVDVLNVSLRHPFLLAGQIAVAQAASRGRVEVGLGAGSYHLARFGHAALRMPFPPLAERRELLARSCRALPALWRGEVVTDPKLGLVEASLGPIGIEPPEIVVGGRSKAAIDIAVRYADGWNGGSGDPEAFRDGARRVDELCRRLGRKRLLRKAVQLFVRDVPLSRARELAVRLEAAGADDVLFVLDEERGPEWVRRLADAVLERLDDSRARGVGPDRKVRHS